MRISWPAGFGRSETATHALSSPPPLSRPFHPLPSASQTNAENQVELIAVILLALLGLVVEFERHSRGRS